MAKQKNADFVRLRLDEKQHLTKLTVEFGFAISANQRLAYSWQISSLAERVLTFK